MATKTKKRGIVDSAVEATIELGEAARGFKESWEHVKRAKKKAAPAGRAVTRTAKKATRAARRMVKRKK